VLGASFPLAPEPIVSEPLDIRTSGYHESLRKPSFWLWDAGAQMPPSRLMGR
jgi:hypothetical protein